MSQPSQMGPAPIAPPSLLHGLPPGTPTEAQIAASQRERARQLQIQQARQQQQQQQNARQMSPPSAQRTSQTPGQGQPHHAGPPTMPNTNINSSAAIAAFGPNAMQNIQMLQNPSHNFIQYMIQSVPGFATLPVPQQLQRMQMVQVSLVLCLTVNGYTDARFKMMTVGFAAKAATKPASAGRAHP
jgi:hypothetical protein